MNEQAILDAYNLFVQNGYKKSVDEFKQLISSNPEALQDSYKLFVGQGYKKSIDDYKSLMGLGAQPVQPVTDKKKVGTELLSEDGSLALPKIKPERAVADATMVKPQMLGTAPKKEEEKTSYLKTLYDNLALGASYVNEAVASLPETVINTFAIPQNYIAEKTGWNIGTNADQIKKQLGIKNPLLDYIQESQKIIKGDVAKDVADRYGSDPGIVSNFQKGNYQTGFELLGAGIVNSAPLSLAMMYGGAVAAPETMMALTTLGLTESQRKELEEMDPTMKESEKMMKALSMSAAESVFESLGTGTIGKVYRDIAAKEGKEAAKGILKNGLVTAYKKALEKTGPVAGFAGEGLEEAATQITQNVIAGRPTFEGVADAFATGAGSGVVFTSPITAVKAKKYIDNKVKNYQAKQGIGEILKDKADQIDNLYNVPVNSDITPEQLQIANIENARIILEKKLKSGVDKGDITQDDAKQSLYVFDKIQQVSNAVKDLDVSTEDKAKIATLLKQRDALKTDIQNKDDVLVVEQKKQIEEINNNIQSIITKSKENAVQEQGPTEGVLRIEGPKLELQQVGEGNQEPQVVAAGTQETLTNEEQARKEELIKALENPNEEKGTVTIGEELIPIKDAQEQLALLEQKVQPEVSLKTQPEITRDVIRAFNDEQVSTLYDEIPMNLLPITEGVTNQDAVYDAYVKAKNSGKHPEFVNAVEQSVQPEEVVMPEELLTVDTNDKTNLQKVYDFLDKLDTDLDKFGRETTGMNLAVPVVKAIIKSVKALVSTGITLQEAIRKAAAENKVSEQDVVDSIKSFSKQRAMQAKPEGVTEMELPGFNRMIGELEGVIEKSRHRGVDEEGTMNNAISYLQGSKVYEDASDTQREQMVRDVRKMFGKREKAAPKPEKLFGDAMDVNMITMSDYELYKQQLKDQAKGAKNAKTVWMKTSQALTKYLKKMADGGYLTAKQTAAVLRKFSGVNMFDEKSIERFVDYMAKVFKNANYAEQIAQINSMLPTARKNAQTKIGVSQTLTPLLNKLFAINPTLIPDSVFDKYAEVVAMMGERKAVLDLQESGKVTDTVEEILDAVDEEVSRSEELAELFDAYEKKVVDEDGKIDFNETLKEMVKDETITEDEAAIMRKYKKNIMPMVEPAAKSEEEIAAEKEVLVEALKDIEVDADGLPMKDERNLARELAKLINTDAVQGLDNTQLKNLLKVIDNINNGYLPHFAELMVERLDAINKSKELSQSVENAKPLKFSTIYSKLKSLITKKDGFSELIRRNPLFYIDQVFGDFKTKNIFNSLFEAAADAQAQFQKSITELNNKLQEAEDAVAKSFKYDANKTLMSKFKMMTFMVQLEHDSNPDSKQVNPASEYLKKTIEHIENGKSSFGKRDAEMLQQVLDEYSDVDGNIDNEKLYDSFNAAEKKAIKTIQDINNEMRDKAIYTAAVIRGDKIHPLNNYVHLNVLHEYKPDEAISGVAFVDDYNNSLRPSTKAKSLIARTGKVAPLNFDVFASANRGAKFTLMDYYLTKPIRTARKTINETSKKLKEDKVGKEKRDIFNAIDRAFEEATENLLTTNFTSTSIGDDVVNFMSKQGYRAVLASLPRFVGELSSNVAFAMIAAPKDFKAGVDYKGVVLSPNASTIMSNVGSKQTNRLFPHDTLSGKLIDTSIMNQASGVRGGRAQSDVANKIQQIYNISVKKYQNLIEVMADALIATPDKMVMRPMWFGSFANEFKNLTGNDVDFDKLAANDELYMAENKEAIDKARIVADEKTVLTGASDNAFMGILKGTPKPNQSAMLRGFNMFNNFMTRFLIYEYVTARTGINAAIGNGSISRKQGVALLGAVATRMTLYTILTQVLSQGLVGLFADDEDKDDDKSLLQKIGQAITSSATALLLGRDFGNAVKSLVNYGIERFNEKYLDFLREGDYDPYKDALQYTIIPQDTKKKKTDAGDLIMNMMGPFGPAVKTTDLIVRKATEEPKKEAAAISRTEKEKNIRIPLEVLGNLGMIPLYKDVRKIVNTELYKELDNVEKKSPMNKIGKEDMKKYFPQMYNELYGPGGTLYDVELMKKEMRKEREKMRKEMKDEMYKYTQ